MKVQQEQGWEREEGKRIHCYLKIAVSVFYSLHMQNKILIIFIVYQPCMN